MSWNLVEDVNAVIFHQLEDNLSCQETGETGPFLQRSFIS